MAMASCFGCVWTADTDWGIVQRSVKDGSIIRRLSGHEGSVRCMTVASAPSRVSRYDTPSAEPALDASVGLNQTGPVRVDSHHSDRQSHGQKVQLWSAADDGIRVWNMEGQCIASLKNESAAAVVSTLLCVTFWDGRYTLHIDTVRTASLQAHARYSPVFVSIVFLPPVVICFQLGRHVLIISHLMEGEGDEGLTPRTVYELAKNSRAHLSTHAHIRTYATMHIYVTVRTQRSAAAQWIVCGVVERTKST